MKPIQINPKKEIIIWLISFAFANLLNIVSIVIYKTRWSELYTQLFFVFQLSILFYFIIVSIRYITKLVKSRHPFQKTV